LTNHVVIVGLATIVVGQQLQVIIFLQFHHYALDAKDLNILHPTK